MFRMGIEEAKAVEKVIMTKQLFRADTELFEAENFEKEYAQKIGTKYAIGVSGGTGALISGLAGLGIGPGDEVIVPGYTFQASALAVLAAGAIPVICDIDETLTISPKEIKRKMSRYTKAIMPVHIMGFPSDMSSIMEIAETSGIKVIEDSCQAVGGSYKGQRLGSIGDVGAFSFNYYKIISSGEGGAVVTDDRKIHERAIIYHDGGTAYRAYAKDLITPIFTGQQYRINEITGAILRVQLKRLDGILEDLRIRKKKLLSYLTEIPGIKCCKSNDIEGDCGLIMPLQFESEKLARKFLSCEGVQGMVVIDHGKHIFTTWDAIINKRAGHHPSMNPFNMKANRKLNMNYSTDMCPSTLDILRRTVYMGIDIDWKNDDIEKLAEACSKAVKTL